MLIYAVASRDSSTQLRSEASQTGRNQNADDFPDTASSNPSIFDPSLRSRWHLLTDVILLFEASKKLRRDLERRTNVMLSRDGKLGFLRMMSLGLFVYHLLRLFFVFIPPGRARN